MGYGPIKSFTKCIEIIQNYQRIKIAGQTFYVEGVARTENLDAQSPGYFLV